MKRWRKLLASTVLLLMVLRARPFAKLLPAHTHTTLNSSLVELKLKKVMCTYRNLGIFTSPFRPWPYWPQHVNLFFGILNTDTPHTYYIMLPICLSRKLVEAKRDEIRGWEPQAEEFSKSLPILIDQSVVMHLYFNAFLCPITKRNLNKQRFNGGFFGL